MKVTYIQPNLIADQSSDAMQPIVFAILAAMTPSDCQIEFYDERIEPLPQELRTDLVVISVQTYTAKRAYQIATQYRHKGVPIILGGFHPSFLPKEALVFSDTVVIGCAESVWERVLSDAKQKKLKCIYRGKDQQTFNKVFPNREIFRQKRYTEIIPVEFGRGCRGYCDFCSVHRFYQTGYYHKAIDHVFQEIELLKKKHIFFVDDNIFIHQKLAEEFFQALIPLKVQWGCQVSLDVAQNDRLLNLMAKSGCSLVVVGFESLDQRNLKLMHKEWLYQKGNYSLAIQKFQNYGLMIYGTFVFGYDFDTIDTFKKSLDFAIKHKFCLANFNPLTPMPGTNLYTRLLKEQRLRYKKWWLDTNYHYGQAIFIPKQMTADQLTEGCFKVRTQFNQYRSIIKRAFDFRTNFRNINRLGLYMFSNVISRREIYRKQGQVLGK